MGLGFSIEQEQQTKQFQRQSAALLAKADLVCSASPLEVQRYLQELELRGCIVQDMSAGYEELSIDEDLAVKELDAEWDFADEDALMVESDESLSEVPETEPFVSDVAYVLRVFRNGGDGGIEIDVPEMGGEAYVGCDKLGLGQTVLQNLNQRRDAYRAIAKWLIGSDAMRQADTVAKFLSIHKQIMQKDFIQKQGLGILEPSFSKYLGAARLAWSDGSIPLRRLFK